MRTHLADFVPGILATILCLAFAPQTAFSGSSTVLGTAFGFGSDEEDVQTSIASIITDYSNTAGYIGYNWHEDHTTRDNIYQAAEGVGSADSIAFYVGHGGGDILADLWFHYCIITKDGEKVYDEDIYSHSADRNVEFVFLYACEQANVIGSSFNKVGMPVAWLHVSGPGDISSDGYNSPDGKGRTFLGFSGFVPRLGDDRFTEGEYLLPDAGYHFLRYFYWRALLFGYDYRINHALDEAVSREWGYPDYGHSFLYNGYDLWDIPQQKYFHGQMKVYGDGNMHLSNSRPISAMKTRTDGYFYVPSGPPPTCSGLRVEMLFDDGNIVGDQYGGTSPYSFIAAYPDGKVDITDAIFLAGKYGLQEGQSGWDYMADIKPDRVVDIFDYVLLASNFGKSGTYSSNVTDVTIRFDMGGHPVEKSVDLNGFVTIPPYATSFVVKQSGNPIGAMAIFWFII